jgi:hypothetical protein
MDFKPVPHPLYDVLRGVLHANLFSTWREDLLQWERTHAAQTATLRSQIAASALTAVVDPDHLRRLSGHWVTDSASTQEWFGQIFREHYGRPPGPGDVARG